MPILNVSVSANPDAALSEKIANELSGLTKNILHKDPGVTSVAITYIAPENWIVGGKSLASQARNSFWLDIKVTAGTNTKSEMADYIEAVFRTMGGVLGELHDTSYTVVHEVPAAAWGFAGKTQEHRFVAGRINSAA
jgi:4-oxalocrotonate tautomerase